MGSRDLDRLAQWLLHGLIPENWPNDICRDAYCGYWERNDGEYYWHRVSDHEDAE